MKLTAEYCLGAALTLGTLVVIGANAPAINPGKSSAIATFKEENVPVDAPFKTMSGHIEYDPAQPTLAKASLEISTASIDLGTPDYNAEAQKKQWLDSADFPKATFISTAVTPGAAGHLEVTGVLTLKGKTQTLKVPVTVSKAGASTVYEGQFAVSRKYYSIGDPEWNDVVDDQVQVRFRFVE